MVLSLPNGESLHRKAERIAFRAIRRPAYYRHVRYVPTLAEATEALAGRGFRARSVEFYGGAPALSGVVGPRRGETLFVLVAERAA